MKAQNLQCEIVVIGACAAGLAAAVSAAEKDEKVIYGRRCPNMPGNESQYRGHNEPGYNLD